MYLFYEKFGCQFLRTDESQLIWCPEFGIWRDWHGYRHIMDDYGDLVCIS